MGCQGFALIQAVCLEEAAEGGAELDVGGGGEMIVGEKIKHEEALIGGEVGDGFEGKEAGAAGDGGVGVLEAGALGVGHTVIL